MKITHSFRNRCRTLALTAALIATVPIHAASSTQWTR